jgi:hypothetical protein
MDVFWGTSSNKKNSWMKAEEHDADIAKVALYGFSGVKTPVPFNTTLYVRDLLKQVGGTREEVREQAAALMKGKIILYGANLSGVNDLIFTPTRDILPGVYLHAMALDNLLRWGPEYKSATGQGLLANDIWRGLWNLLIVLPVAMLLAFFYRRPDSGTPIPDQGASRVLRSVCIILALACWFAAWGIVEFVYFNVSAGTVAGYLAFLTLGFFLNIIGMADWLMDHVPTWKTKVCSRLARTLGRH